MKQKFSENFCVFWVFLGWRWHEYRLHEWSLGTTVVATSCTLIFQIMKVQNVWSIKMTKMV